MNTSHKSENLTNVSLSINILAQYGDNLGSSLATLGKELSLKLEQWGSPGFTHFEETHDMWATPIWDRDDFNTFSLLPLAQSSHYFINRNLEVAGIRGTRKGDAIVSIIALPNGAFEKAGLEENPNLTSIPVEAPILRAYVHMVKEDFKNQSFRNLYNNLQDFPTDVDGFFEPAMPNVAAWVREFDLGKFLSDPQEVITAVADILKTMV
ncbi:MAG: hypothetical protein LBE27_04545 [Deltaproteobacteria bacterium]|jgi:hypothetical protein|nr:hypothetical protein [Deltaproteobacteria bacterium]